MEPDLTFTFEKDNIFEGQDVYTIKYGAEDWHISGREAQQNYYISSEVSNMPHSQGARESIAACRWLPCDGYQRLDQRSD